MNKCGRCTKTVYPTEELKCLDKSWHKGCFKCQECGMTLNMRTYKGFNKMPYCNAHVPQVKHTAVVDTPEAKRLAENTRIQSNIKYHEAFEKQKGRVTQVADDPETVRIRNTSKIISNVAYHGELEKKKQMEQKRTLLPDGTTASSNEDLEDGYKYVSAINKVEQEPYQNKNRVVPNSGRGDQNSNHQMIKEHHVPQNQSQLQQQFSQNQQQQRGPVYGKESTGYTTKIQQSNVIYTSNQGPVNDLTGRKVVGSIADYDPMNENYGSIASGYGGRGGQTLVSGGGGGYYPGQVMHQSSPAQHVQHQAAIHQQVVEQQQVTPPIQRMARCVVYRAMYDYMAQDTDEVSFLDGDLIVNCVPIDEGWMTGTVQRTGLTGMLPANYVEPNYS